MMLVFILLIGVLSSRPDSVRSCDVVVYTATASGVMAAVAAAGEGMRVLLVEPGRHVGGMVSGGLSHTDFGDRAVIGGLALEFYRRVGEHYGKPTYYWRGPEPHVAEEILREWLSDAGVEMLFERRLDSVQKHGRRIESIRLSDGMQVQASVFIDAGYEGDLMARAGVSYTFGREGREVYQESWAGRQPILPDRHQFLVGISPFDAEGNLLPLIKPEPMVEVGEGDGGIQSYGFRLLLTRRPDLRIPFPKPAGYDPADRPEGRQSNTDRPEGRQSNSDRPEGRPSDNEFELMRRLLKKQGDQLNARYFFTLRPNLPNEKAEINSVGPISLNLLDGSSWAYPDADYPARDSLWNRHLEYAKRLMYFMANDPSVPEHIRSEVAEWGLSRDEFVDTEHWPHQLYVRTGRRMLGEYVMTQKDLEVDTVKYDAIGMGSYNIDVREVQRTWIRMSRFPELVPEVYNEGYISIPVAPYQIPYRAITPRYQEADNLLVPVCLSSSHVANSSIRMEPQYMILGQAAGIAASLAVRDSLAVQRVPMGDLQARLASQGQILSLEGRPNGPFQTDSSFVVDDDMTRFVERSGSWLHLEDPVDRYGMSYLVAQEESSVMRFRPELPEKGTYVISAWWPSGGAADVSIMVRHASGTERLIVDQTDGGEWVPLGRWRFENGRQGFVEIAGRGSVADAVKFEREK